MVGRLATVLLVLVSLQNLLDVCTALPDWITPEMIEMVKDDKERCMAEHGTTQDMIDNGNNGNILNDPKLTCYMHCLFETFGVIDEDGAFEAELLLAFFPEEIQAKGRDVLETCGQESDPDMCTKVYKIVSCVYHKNPAMFFMV